jgi:shikimate kinase
MRVSLIGMSNIGKTFWARRVAAATGIELIEKQLGPELKQLGFSGLHELAKWMGQPPDPHYAENSKRYMAGEQKVMRTALNFLHTNIGTRAIIDTTGSVIYTDPQTLSDLREQTKVIYFAASDDHIAELFKRYLANPKPTIWADCYVPAEGEAPRQALKRCYPELLHARAQQYQALAHVTIPYERHRDRQVDVSAIIADMEVS